MSSPRLLYISGEPGIGKSTLMRDATSVWERIHLPAEPGRTPHRDLLFHRAHPGVCCAVELGRLRDTLSGTDALPANCITDAEAWLRSGQAARESALILAEGARLANQRFLTAALESGYHVQLLHLQGTSLAAHRRSYRARIHGCDEQNPSRVKGRRTAAADLALHAPQWGVEVLLVDATRLDDLGYRDTILNTIRYGWASNLTPD